MKAIYDKSTANTIDNSEKLKESPLRSRTRQVCPLLPLLFSSFEVLAVIIRGEKEIKESRLEKK